MPNITRMQYLCVYGGGGEGGRGGVGEVIGGRVCVRGWVGG
jgi:hypothetical protein